MQERKQTGLQLAEVSTLLWTVFVPFILTPPPPQIRVDLARLNGFSVVISINPWLKMLSLISNGLEVTRGVLFFSWGFLFWVWGFFFGFVWFFLGGGGVFCLVWFFWMLS